MKNTFLLFLSIVVIAVNIAAQVFPDEIWTYNKNPELDGWDSAGMISFNRYIIDSTHITGLMIIHKGEIVFDYGDIEENSYIASCRKSVLAILYGKYVMNGQIDLNKTLNDLQIEDVNKLLPIEKEATIQDLISARSGVFLNGSNGGDLRDYAPERGSVKPGEYWLYSNWDFNLAGSIFEKESGNNIYNEVETQLAIPLQMQDWDRSLQTKYGDSTLSLFPAYHMWFSTRDMARIGLLMLNMGKWNNQQLIEEKWVDEMIKQRTTYKELSDNVPIFIDSGVDFGYGYMWWLWENTNDKRFNKAYSALGAWGQSITVFPNIDVVVAYKTKSDYRRRNSSEARLKLLIKAAELYDLKK